MSKRKSYPFLLMVIIATITGATTNAKGGDPIFIEHEQYASRLELKLAIFDLKVNYLNILSRKSSFSFLSEIYSQGTQSKIYSYVWVSPSIMDGALKEKRERIKTLCENLFEVYQKRFPMMDKKYLKHHTGPISGVLMKSCNLVIKVYIREGKRLAEWGCGTISFEDGFFE